MSQTLLFIVLFPLIGFSQDSIKVYYPTGSIKTIRLVKDSGHVYEKIYYENGMLSSEGEAIGSRKIIKWVNAYYKNGAPKLIINDTAERFYSDDGNYYAYYPRQMNARHGRAKFYIEGKLSYEHDFNNGVKEGFHMRYDLETGKLQAEETIISGKKEGQARHYDKEGKVSKIITYRNNCAVKVQYLDNNGRVKRTLTGKKEIWLAEGVASDCI